MDNITYRVDDATARDLMALFAFFEEADLRDAFCRAGASDSVIVSRQTHAHLLRFFAKLTLDDVHRAFQDCPAEALEAKSDRVFCFYFCDAIIAGKEGDK